MRPQVLDDEQRGVRVGLLWQRPLRARRRRAARRAPRRPPRRVRRRRPRSHSSSSSGADPVAGRRDRDAHRRPAPWVEHVVERAADEREGETTSTMQTPGGTKYHHAPRPGAPALARSVQQLAPRRLERIAKADERQRRLGQDRAGEHQHRVGDDQAQDVGQDVAAHDVARPGPDDPGPIDERPLLDRQRLRTGRSAPSTPSCVMPMTMTITMQRDPDAEELAIGADDLAQDRRQDQRQDERRQDQEEVGDAHQDRVDAAADEPATDPDRHPDERP